MTMRALLFVPFVVAVLSAGSPDKGSFTSGVWHGKANYDGDGKFSDCTMMAQSKSGVLLGFVISKDFDWGSCSPTKDAASKSERPCPCLC